MHEIIVPFSFKNTLLHRYLFRAWLIPFDFNLDMPRLTIRQ